MTHVALTVNYSPWSAYSGGGQQSTHYLAQALAARGHRVTVVYTKAPFDQISVPANLDYEIKWARFIALRSRSGSPLRPLNAISVTRVVQDLIEKEGVSVVNCQGEEGALLPRLRTKTRPFRLLATPRYPSYPARLVAKPSNLRAALGRWTVPPKYLALAQLLKGADRCCPTSEASARSLTQAFGIAEDRMHVIPNGIATTFLETERSPRAQQGPLLFFGRIEHSKGLDTLLEAMALLGQAAPPLVVVGRGRSEHKARKLVETLGLHNKVRFEGWKTSEELANLLSEARIAVLPSREESFGNAMVEAMAVGTPLITTRVGSIPELTQEGKTAVLVAPNDPHALANEISALLKDSTFAAKLGSAARAHVRAHYSWELSAEKLEALWNSFELN